MTNNRFDYSVYENLLEKETYNIYTKSHHVDYKKSQIYVGLGNNGITVRDGMRGLGISGRRLNSMMKELATYSDREDISPRETRRIESLLKKIDAFADNLISRVVKGKVRTEDVIHFHTLDANSDTRIVMNKNVDEGKIVVGNIPPTRTREVDGILQIEVPSALDRLSQKEAVLPNEQLKDIMSKAFGPEDIHNEFFKGMRELVDSSPTRMERIFVKDTKTNLMGKIDEIAKSGKDLSKYPNLKKIVKAYNEEKGIDAILDEVSKIDKSGSEAISVSPEIIRTNKRRGKSNTTQVRTNKRVGKSIVD